MDAMNLPTVLDLPAAATMLGIGRTKAYDLVRDDSWPTPIIRLGKLIMVPTVGEVTSRSVRPLCRQG